MSYRIPRIPLWFSIRCHLEKINLAEQSFDVDGWLNFFWVDPYIFEQGQGKSWEYSAQTAFINIEDDGKNQPINRHAMFENAIKCQMLMDPVFRYNTKTGLIQETIHFKATFVEAMEIASFPFDRQYLSMRICVRTNDFECVEWPPDYVPNRLNMRELASCTVSPAISDWNMLSPAVGYSYASGQTDDLNIDVSLRLERDAVYWLFNCLVVFLLVAMTLTSFAFKDELADRIIVSLLLLLALLLFRVLLAANVPRSSTITLLDKYFALSNTFILLVALEPVIRHLYVKDMHRLQFDMTSAAGLAVAWLLLHLWILWTARTGGFCVPWHQLKQEGAGTMPSYTAARENIVLGQALPPSRRPRSAVLDAGQGAADGAALRLRRGRFLSPAQPAQPARAREPPWSDPPSRTNASAPLRAGR